MEIDLKNVPKHIGIIMDGNGRWAQSKNKIRSFGHKEGAERVIDIVEESYRLGVKYLTLYAFSTENWKRPADEVGYLMTLLNSFIDKKLKRLHENGVKINVLGEIERFDDKTFKSVKKAIDTTKDNKKMVLNIALSYGGRAEIVRAAKIIAKNYKEGSLNLDDLNEDNFNDYLYTKNIPPVDLLIRPGGEKRISNFLLYQLAYAEFIFVDTLWPDFREENLQEAILEYQNRNRRYGGI
ncbi:isoprenyl transferase [Peptoniphilus sp.]|uniref:isoprenyl transferase n=1 Tax=Peptoniphilus sp. TaxID=1971214 RepID=UPI003991E68F